MASSPAKKLSLLLLLTLLSFPQTQARDSQLFSKASAATTNQEPPANNNQQQQLNFFHQENENGYGLYGHETGRGQLPRSAADSEDDPLHRQLPRNYNPVAYVTESSDSNPYTDQYSYTNNLKNYYNDAQKNYNNRQEDEEMSEPEQYRYNNNNQYYGGSSFNSEPQGLRDTRLSGRDAADHNSRENYFYNGGEEIGFRPQGMSDTRSLENGKYFYDIKTEKYSNNHPYEVLLNRAVANDNYNERSYYGASEKSMTDYGASENSMRESYQNQYQFQNEGSMP